MSDKNRHPHIAHNGLLSLGNISGLLHEVNGQQHVVGDMENTVHENNPNIDSKGKIVRPSQESKQKESGKEKPTSRTDKETTKAKTSKTILHNDTFSYIASRQQSDTHRIDRKADKVAYIRTEIITAFRQCYREKATHAINEVLRKYIEDNKERLREQRTDKGSLLDR